MSAKIAVSNVGLVFTSIIALADVNAEEINTLRCKLLQALGKTPPHPLLDSKDEP
jgi:hypothetical protein